MAVIRDTRGSRSRDEMMGVTEGVGLTSRRCQDQIVTFILICVQGPVRNTEGRDSVLIRHNWEETECKYFVPILKENFQVSVLEY